MKTKLFTCFLFSCISAFANFEDDSDVKLSLDPQTEEKQTQCVNERHLTGQEYYDAALRGELVEEANSNSFLNFSELTFIGYLSPYWYYRYIIEEKLSGDECYTSNTIEKSSDYWEKRNENNALKEGLYQDLEGNFWFVEKAGFWLHPQSKEESLINKYLGLKVMKLLVGPCSAEVKLIKDFPEYIAIKRFPGLIHASRRKDGDFSFERLKLEIAMDFVGLQVLEFRDRHEKVGERNYFHINGSIVMPTRWSLETSIFHAYLDDEKYLYIWKDIGEASMAVESILNISDEQILYTLGDAYNDLLTSGIKLDDEYYKEAGNKLIKKKEQLKKTYEVFTILARIENDPEFFTYENEKFLNDKINVSLTNYAIRRGLLNFTKLLKNREDNDALRLAAEYGHLEVVKFLVEKKVNLNPKKGYRYSALCEAFENNQQEVAEFLLSNGAMPNDCKDWWDEFFEFGSYLTTALEWRRPDLVRLLLEKRKNPDVIGQYGKTPLSVAASLNDLASAKLFLELGVNANVKDGSYRNGASPIHYAAEYGHVAMLKLLLEHGADINCQNDSQVWLKLGHYSKNTTPLMIAVINNHFESAKLLLEKGSDAYFKNEENKTALDLAIKFGHSKIEVLLREYLKVDD